VPAAQPPAADSFDIVKTGSRIGYFSASRGKVELIEMGKKGSRSQIADAVRDPIFRGCDLERA
jgi:hypothetical protein